MLLTVPQLVASACQNVKRMDATSAYAEGRPVSGVFIDVREPGEAANKSIPGSINIPRGVLEMKIGEVASDASTKIYLHCATGGRAALAAEQLQRLGYENVTAISCPLDVIYEVETKFQ